jgi:hypothetical protein
VQRRQISNLLFTKDSWIRLLYRSVNDQARRIYFYWWHCYCLIEWQLLQVKQKRGAGPDSTSMQYGIPVSELFYSYERLRELGNSIPLTAHLKWLASTRSSVCSVKCYFLIHGDFPFQDVTCCDLSQPCLELSR